MFLRHVQPCIKQDVRLQDNRGVHLSAEDNVWAWNREILVFTCVEELRLSALACACWM